MRKFTLFDEFAGSVTGEVVEKHGRHDQSSHGRRGGGQRTLIDEVRQRQQEDVDYIMGRTMIPPSWTGLPPTRYVPKPRLSDRVASARRKIAKWKQQRERRAMERMSPAEIDKLIAANRARVDAKRAARGLPPRVYKATDPIFSILQRVLGDAVEPSLWVALIEDPRPLTELTGPLGDLVDDMLDAVIPAETVIKFAPGLRPVLKHGSHDQAAHGGRRRRQRPPQSNERGEPGVRDDAPAAVRRVSEALGDKKAFSEYVSSCDRGGGCEDAAAAIERDFGIPQVHGTFTTRAGQREYHSWNMTDSGWIVDAGQEGSRAGWDGDGLMVYPPGAGQFEMRGYGVQKHLAGKHDQMSHGRGGGRQLTIDGDGGGGDGGGGDGPYAAWGDRAREIGFAEGAGMPRSELESALLSDGSDIDDEFVRETIENRFDYEIEYEVEQRMSRTLGMEDEDEVEATRQQYREEEIDNIVRSYGDEIRQELAAEYAQEMFDSDAAIQQFDEVYGTYHEGVTRDGTPVTLSASVESAYLQASYDERSIEVSGTIYDADTGAWAGEFKRSFAPDGEGGVMVTHELLRLDDEYQGSGFAKTFNRQAENYYISHGIEQVNVHAALDGGGYAWASQGFDWDYRNHGASKGNIGRRLEMYANQTGIPSSLSRDVTSVRRRLDLSVDDPDYPTPREISQIGMIPGVSTWPGKDIMRGSNWYGTKTLSPEGPRVSSTERTAAARRKAQAAYEAERAGFAAQRAPGSGQLTMDSDFLEGALAQAPNQTIPLFPPIPGVVE